MQSLTAPPINPQRCCLTVTTVMFIMEVKGAAVGEEYSAEPPSPAFLPLSLHGCCDGFQLFLKLVFVFGTTLLSALLVILSVNIFYFNKKSIFARIFGHGNQSQNSQKNLFSNLLSFQKFLSKMPILKPLLIPLCKIQCSGPRLGLLNIRKGCSIFSTGFNYRIFVVCQLFLLR